MADLRISELNSLASADLAANDWLPVADRSASETKKITVADFLNKAVTEISDDVIPSAKILFDSQSIPGGAFVNGAVGSDQISSNAVDSTKLADNSSAQVVTALPASGVFAGQLAVETSTNKAYVWDGSAWVSFKAAGSINQLVATTAGPIRISVATVGDVATLSVNPQITPAGGIFLAGPAGSGGEVSGRAIVGSDLPTASNVAKGAVIVNGEGLRMDGDTLEIDNDVSATNTFSVVTHNSKGVITGSKVIDSTDLPNATASATGAVQPGTGLSVTNAGVLNHTNAVTAGTATKITFDAQGHVTNGGTLTEDDIPDIPASKLTSGTLQSGVYGTNSIPGSGIADEATTQFGGPGTTAQITTFPNADFKGQFFYDVSRNDLYIWDGSAWLPVTVTSGELVYAGTYDASTNQIGSLSAAGSGLGLAVGDALPSPAEQNKQYYFVVENTGNGTSPAPGVLLEAPDQLISNGTGTTWELIDVSGTITGDTAENTSFVPFTGVSSTDVQAAIEEVYNESIRATGGTVTGNILLNANLEIGTGGSLTFEGSTADIYETTLTAVDPTADRTITLPNVSGTVITTGDTGTVSNTMLTGSIAYSKLSLTGAIVNADINASAAIAYSKLNLSNTIVNGDINASAAIAYSKLNLTGNVTNADINASAAIDYTKLNLTGNITNADINASAAIADTKLAQIATAGKVSGGAITSGTIAGTTAINTSGAITTTGTISDGAGPIRRIPQNAQTSNYDLTAADVGKHISITAGGVNVLASVFSIGDNVTIFNNSTSNQSIVQGPGVTLRAGGQTTTGTRTLANYGVATILCVAADVFVVTGTGLT